jgi:hypothetical protein
MVLERAGGRGHKKEELQKAENGLPATHSNDERPTFRLTLRRRISKRRPLEAYRRPEDEAQMGTHGSRHR